MKLYVIAIADGAGRMQSYGIVAATRDAAESKARELAGVASDAEPQSTQTMHAVHAVVE